MIFIVNDHVDIALSVNADGVHLGQDDFPLQAARELAPDLILGISSHSKEEALEAQENGADYVNIGPIYPTETKKLSCKYLGTEALKEIPPLLNIPFTVMGGIKQKHIPELISLGASRIAMVTEITQAENVTEKVKQLRACWK
jgi:thiamine-phosphate pyrophosphorylase